MNNILDSTKCILNDACSIGIEGNTILGECVADWCARIGKTKALNQLTQFVKAEGKLSTYQINRVQVVLKSAVKV